MDIPGQYRAHWFLGTYVIILAVWGALGLAYLLGADGVTVRSKSGQSATLDFMRDQEAPIVLGLADGAGLRLELDDSLPGQISAHVIVLEPVPAVFCLCGDSWTPYSLAQVGFRRGDWFFHEPTDLSQRGSLDSGSAKWRDAALTLAYNPVTQQRILQEQGDTLEQQRQLLAEQGLSVSDDAVLELSALEDLELVAMRSEACLIYFGAFLSSLLLWLLVGGPIALIARSRRMRQ